MKLRNKILAYFGFSWLILYAILAFGSYYIFSKNFCVIEDQQVSTNLERIKQAIAKTLSAIGTMTSDWSSWDDTYRFIQDRNATYIRANLANALFVNGEINAILYYNSLDKLVIGKSIDVNSGKTVPLPLGMTQYIAKHSQLINHPSISSKKLGFIDLPQGMMLLASIPILTSSKTGPIRGTLIMARHFNQANLEEIAKTTQLSVHLITLKQLHNQPTLLSIYNKLLENSEYITDRVSDNKIIGYMLIKDINNDPIAMIKITSQRKFYAYGVRTIAYYLWCLFIFGIIIAILLWKLLDYLILRRLESFNQQVLEIAVNNNYSKRVNIAGNDELLSITTSINTLLNIIENTHEQLEARVKERTLELQSAIKQLQQEIFTRKTTEQQLQASQKNLVQLAHYDTLTQLPNRVLFNQLIYDAIKEAKKAHHIFAVIILDIDRFKHFNDALGHTLGDKLLQAVAKRLQGAITTPNLIGRLGGDEFIFLIKDINFAQQASKITQNLLNVFTKPITINNQEFYLNASIGVSIFPSDGETLEDLLRSADLAMYKAKHAGGGCYYYYSGNMEQHALKLIQLEADMRRALANNEFIIFYQPKIDLVTQSITGFEALLRWQHPTLGLIYPNDFITIAEETSLIHQIGEITLQKVCQILKKWQGQGYQPLPIAVNLSAIQFRNHKLVPTIAKILQDVAIEPTYLELEITESAIMDNVNFTITNLTELSNMGITIAVDDFGTGYSSISYLKQFPIKILKIDKSFINHIPENQDDIAIAQSIIALGHSLNLKIVAEGVETIEQVQCLKQLHCDMAQGYYFSRPLPENKIISLLIKQSI